MTKMCAGVNPLMIKCIKNSAGLKGSYRGMICLIARIVDTHGMRCGRRLTTAAHFFVAKVLVLLRQRAEIERGF
jgi:hypothetical protein